MQREELKEKIQFLEICIEDDENLIEYLTRGIRYNTHDLNNAVVSCNNRKRELARYREQLEEIEKINKS